MAFKHIISRDNSIFKHLKRVADNTKYRRKSALTLLEGVHLIEAYEQVFGMPELLIVPEGDSSAEATILMQRLADVDTVMLPTLMFAEVAPVATSTGVMALINVPELPQAEKIDLALLLVDIQDPGNFGSILRTAVAAGVQTVYCSTACADAWSPKALRGGQGAQLMLPIIERVTPEALMTSFAGSSYAMTMQGESLYQQDLTQPSLFVMGNEGAGLPSHLVAAATRAITIPMANSNAAIESLNVAAATAISLFECKRQRM